MGGMVPCIQSGLIQKEIAAEAYRHQQRVENGEQVVVGVNKFTREEPERQQLQLWELDPAIGARQRDELARVKAQRDNSVVARALDNLRDMARSDRSLMPAMMDAVRAYASIGEICGVLREEFGSFQEPAGI